MAQEAPSTAPSESDLQNWRFLEQFRDALRKVLKDRPEAPSFAEPKRKLSRESYLSLFLLGLFNPCVRTMRALCGVSHLRRVQDQACERPVSLGSFSEAQHVVDPALLEQVFAQLSQEVPPHPQDARLGQWAWLAHDGSLFHALPRMTWALYGGGPVGAANNAVRLHLSLNILEDKPQAAVLRPGKVCERKVWRSQWQRGQAYIADRYFGEDYKVFRQLERQGCVYVLRLRNEAVITVEEELPLTPEDVAAGVQRQAWVRLGCCRRVLSVRLRLVWVRTREGNVVLLATNLTVASMSAALVWMLYKERWKVELFFRWIKCILGCRHWLAEGPQGVAIQIYLALIAALLLQLRVGCRPNKRMMELIQLHQMGIATAEELAAGLQRQFNRMGRKRA